MKHVKMEMGCKGGSALCTCENKSETKKCIRLSECDDSNESEIESEVDSDSSESWVQDSDGYWVPGGCCSGLESEGACDC